MKLKNESMNLIQKVLLKLRIEIRFLLEQKWGVKKPSDPFSISKSLLRKYLPSNPIIIDCGAHVGTDSIELARIFPNALIHSFEPIPSIFEKLKSNTKKYSNVICYQIALSNVDGVAKMFVSSGNSDASSSLLEPTGHLLNHPDVYFDDIIEVPAYTLDSWAKKYNVKQVDFLWLDMQGFELNLLQASNKILDTVKLIHTEVSITETYENSPLYNDLKAWLNGKGFKMIFEALPSGTDMGNVLFVKEQI